MTPAYLAARVEVRERRALSEYRTARAIWRARLWTSGARDAAVFREALVARARWSYLHDLQREPELQHTREKALRLGREARTPDEFAVAIIEAVKAADDAVDAL